MTAETAWGFSPGQDIRVTDGLLKGWQGIVIHLTGKVEVVLVFLTNSPSRLKVASVEAVLRPEQIENHPRSPVF